jgi:hypothetical protein
MRDIAFKFTNAPLHRLFIFTCGNLRAGRGLAGAWPGPGRGICELAGAWPGKLAGGKKPRGKSPPGPGAPGPRPRGRGPRGPRGAPRFFLPSPGPAGPPAGPRGIRPCMAGSRSGGSICLSAGGSSGGTTTPPTGKRFARTVFGISRSRRNCSFITTAVSVQSQ